MPFDITSSQQVVAFNVGLEWSRATFNSIVYSLLNSNWFK